MSQNKPFGYEDLMVVDYTGGYDIQQALNSRKRKRHLDTGVVAEEDDIEEALTLPQRRKLKLAMRRNKAKILRGRKIAMRRKPRLADIKKRSRKRAIAQVKKILSKGKDLGGLSVARRSELEKRLKTKAGLVKRIQRKSAIDIRKGD
jgi:hypothetical protein